MEHKKNAIQLKNKQEKGEKMKTYLRLNEPHIDVLKKEVEKYKTQEKKKK